LLPLVIAQGAGAEMRRTLGKAVFAGMIGVTLFGIFLTPVFYSVVRWLSDRGPGESALMRGAGAAPARTIPEGPVEATPGAFDGGQQERRIRQP
jgi:multidrug efflux pump